MSGRAWAVSLVVVGVAACAAPTEPLPDPCPPVAPYLPAPRVLDEDTRGCLPVTRACIYGDDAGAAVVGAALEAVGIPIATDDVCEWRIQLSALDAWLSPKLRAAYTASTANERFAIETRIGVGDGVAQTSIVTADPRGVRHAARVLAARVRANGTTIAIARVALFDRPSIPVRGIVEGFYGDPYAIEERRVLLELMAQTGMNTYLYGPKGDPFHRLEWRLPYDESGAAAMRALVDDAHARGIEPIWAISPAWDGYNELEKSIQFSKGDDFVALTAKIEQMRALGFARFGLFVDDIAVAFGYAADNTAFSSVAAGHAALANRLLAYLKQTDPAARLYFVGRDYSEYQTTWVDYNRVLGQTLDDDIDVMWTGNKVYSESISVADVEKPRALLGRKVTIWDNHPEGVVPLSSRSVQLPTAIDGFFSNPVMNEWRAYPVTDFWSVVGTLGVYMWNTESYEPVLVFDWWRERRGGTSGPLPVF